MTKLEQVSNIIDNSMTENKRSKFIQLYWDIIEKEVNNWSDKYFDNNIHYFVAILVEINEVRILNKTYHHGINLNSLGSK